MECPWRNKHLFVKRISREEEMERVRKERTRRSKKKDEVSDSSMIEIQSERKMETDEVHLRRGNAAPGPADVIQPGTHQTWIPLGTLTNCVSCMILGKNFKT